ncbi:glycosyltransferase [uncultured Eubacterium sp.]|uniref:glycosyltransferase n=1 Tax=uncultured Eubacterium sp. TaxID=165185 RepID=UPI0025DCF9DA|nr:glycosyltransferase [uncultured Eubacterium sp.]
MNDEVMVSIQCITYNHEKYIQKALDGFVMQKTNFKFEVIIHDDASTDRTTEIIKEYAEKYDFIIPIFQKENQYSQKIPFVTKYVYPLMRGKYIAYCEGDDYWTDSNKLQVLYDYMEANPRCSMCCHAYENIEANTEKQIEEIHTLSRDGEISIQKAIKYDNPTQLASQMFRRECVINKPEIYHNRGVGDYTVLLYAATLGEIHYIDRIMARHRVASDGSWTNRVYRNKKLRINHDESMISFLVDFDQYYNGRYHEHVYDKIDEYIFDILISKGEYKKIIDHKYFNTLTMKRKILVRIGILFPTVINKIFEKHDFL